MAFARVDKVGATSPVRMIPVQGGTFGDGPSTIFGHTFKEYHGGVDIYGTDPTRAVRAASALKIIRIVDSSADPPTSSHGAAGPKWIDAYELDGGENLVERYLHLVTIAPGVKEDSELKPGDPLGTYWEKTFNGNRGHLHFEIRELDSKGGTYGKVLNPQDWLKGKSSTVQRTAKLVCMLKQEDVYKTLTPGQTLYVKSGQRLTITALPGYPWIQSLVLDDGTVDGPVTQDIGEAADWTLESAKEDTNIRLSDVTAPGFWATNIAPLDGRILKAKALAPIDRYVEAWTIRKDVAALRGLSFFPKQIQAFTSAASTVGTAVSNAAGQVATGAGKLAADVRSSIWESIPTGVKIGAVAVAGVAGLAVVARIAGK